jgi:adenylate kinase family enzyme
MQKVLVIGSGGAGKSTFARNLGVATGLPVLHLDKIHWRPGWVAPAKDEWRKLVADALQGEAWIMDGNFSGTLEMRLAACDTVVFLELPRWVCLYRVLKRRLRHWNTNRPDMAEGCHEKLDGEFIGWIWRYPQETKPKVDAILSRFAGEKNIVRLRSQKEVDAFLRRHRRQV